jgi:hypothetical protein
VGKVGVFRTSAGANTVRQLLKACECLYRKRAGREEMELLFAPYAREVDVVASVLKAYLREQSRPFLPVSLHDSFLASSGTSHTRTRLSVSTAQKNSHDTRHDTHGRRDQRH